MIAKTIQYRFYCSLLVLLLAFVFPLIFCFSEPEERSQRRHSLKSLQKFVGLDLDSVKENKLKELERALLQIDSTRTLNHSWAFGPHTIWDYYRMGTKPNYLICDCSKFNMHPGSTTIQLTHFDGNGIVHAKSKFTTGHRQYLDKYPFTALSAE